MRMIISPKIADHLFDRLLLHTVCIDKNNGVIGRVPGTSHLDIYNMLVSGRIPGQHSLTTDSSYSILKHMLRYLTVKGTHKSSTKYFFGDESDKGDIIFHL